MRSVRFPGISADSHYWPAQKDALGVQIPILLLTSQILDGGTVFAICLYASVGFWVGAYWAQKRRPLPTKADLIFVRFGYLPLCFVSWHVAEISHHWDMYH